MQTVTCFPQRPVKSVKTALQHTLTTLFLTTVIALVASGSHQTAQAAEKTNDPNIIYILADDKN